MKIGPVEPHNPFFLAPMAGYTCSGMRKLFLELGAGLLYTEMTVAMHVVRAPEETLRQLNYDPSDRPVFAQLAAEGPESAAHATKFITDLGFDGIDLNLGCSVRRIASGGMGSGLAADLPQLEKVLRAMVKATTLPVTAKMRSGPDEQTVSAPEVAKVCEECGAVAVAVHGRHARQGYTGKSDSSVIALVKQSVRIPVIGNGDVRTPADAIDMMSETGCDAVMIGRGALGNPWIFARSAKLLDSGECPPPPTPAEARRVMLKHYQLLVDEKGRHYANLLFRKQTSYYAKFTPHPRKLRRAIHQCGNNDDLSVVIRELVTP